MYLSPRWEKSCEAPLGGAVSRSRASTASMSPVRGSILEQSLFAFTSTGAPAPGVGFRQASSNALDAMRSFFLTEKLSVIWQGVPVVRRA